MDVLTRIVSTVAIGFLILTTGLGTTAYALAMDGKTGHCAEHMSMLHDAKVATIEDTDQPPVENMVERSDSDHERCQVKMCPGLTTLAPQLSVGMVHFDLAQTDFVSDLRHLKQAETPDRPPNS